jgi:hypothetical protein
VGPATARRVRCASDEGNDGGNGRGLTTTAADARILPMPNLRTTRGMLLPPPLLEISRGAPLSRRGGKEAEEEEEALQAPSAGCRDASRRAAAASCPLGAPPPIVR